MASPAVQQLDRLLGANMLMILQTMIKKARSNVTSDTSEWTWVEKGTSTMGSAAQSQWTLWLYF